MDFSLKPTSITLPENTNFCKRSPNCSPSVSFQTNPFDKLSEYINQSNSGTPIPKAPFPTNNNKNNSIENLEFFTPQPSPMFSNFGQLHSVPTNTIVNSVKNTENIRPLLPVELNEMLGQVKSYPKLLLVIDTRPAIHFSKSHIPGNTVNVNIPTTFVKRASYDLQKVYGSTSNDSERALLQSWESYQTVIFLDAATPELSTDNPLYYLFIKFVSAKANLPTMYWLRGGFKGFQAAYPQSVTVNKKPLLASALPFSKLANNKPLMISNLTPSCESNSNAFYDCLRQYNTANTCSEVIPIQMPSQNMITSTPSLACPSTLPPFLQKMLEANHGEKAMADAFQRLDLSEQNRLKDIATAKPLSQGVDKYSVSAGIEKGHKNRYMNIWPYEHSRIKLSEHANNETDYVNASLVTEHITKNRYIATQGPLPSTFLDFWQLIWQCDSRLIVMLTNEEEGGRVRCHRYWPDQLGETKNIDGRYEVKFVQQDVCSNTGLLTLRKFILSKIGTQKSRLIMQIQYTGWPDYGVPDEPTTLLRVRNLARHLQNAASAQISNEAGMQLSAGPMVIHCSAGCGRTGAFCTIDSAIEALDTGVANLYSDIVYDIVDSFRDQRLSMVQTHRQLVLCYETLIWYLLTDRRCGDLSGLCPNLRRIDLSIPDPTTPYYTPFGHPDQIRGDYFTPMVGDMQTSYNRGGDSYFSLPPSTPSFAAAANSSAPAFNFNLPLKTPGIPKSNKDNGFPFR